MHMIQLSPDPVVVTMLEAWDLLQDHTRPDGLLNLIVKAGEKAVLSSTQ